MAGVAAVLGHNFPFYLKLKSGKGLASMVMILRHRKNYVRIWKGSEIGALRYPNGWKYTEKKVKK